MDDINKCDTGLCLAVGAGAIGKSITGYVFRQLGFKVVFADAVPEVIADINRRKGYNIKITETGKADSNYFVSGVTAVHISDNAIDELVLKADYICTAIGAGGIKALLPEITKWIEIRNHIQSKKLYILLFENDMQCKKLLTDAITEAIGFFPEWLEIVKTSIERMTKPFKNNNEFDVVSEKFIPVIAPKPQLSGSSICDKPDLFMLVDNVDAYYSRKLYTNNLGHAVLGYMGCCFGYENTFQAMNNAFIYVSLMNVLHEACNMLKCKYGFSDSEMDTHFAGLVSRYKNQGLNDSLTRLSRDPVRKLGSNERIIGAIRKCIEYGIAPNAIIKILFYAVNYKNEDDPSAGLLAKTLSEGGIGSVLTQICGIDSTEPLYEDICRRYADFKPHG